MRPMRPSNPCGWTASTRTRYASPSASSRPAQHAPHSASTSGARQASMPSPDLAQVLFELGERLRERAAGEPSARDGRR